MDKRKENHQLFLRDMAEQNYKMSARPLELMIGLTNVCNLQCVFCPYCGICTKKIEKKSEISLQNIENLGRTFFETAEFLNPSLRGEPFLYTYFKQFMQLCSKSGILQRTQLINNGTKLDKYDLKKLEGINIISISFDGATQEVFEALRTGANFYQVLSNMERLRRELPETVLQITVVVCRLNLHQLADIYAIAREKGFNYITFNTIYGPETDKVIQLLRLRESDRELLSEQLEKISKLNMDHKMTVMDVTSFDGYDDEIPLDCQKIMEELKELRKAEPYLDFDGERDISHPERRIHYERQNAFPYIYIYIYGKKTRLPYCTGPWSILSVMPDGKVLPCCASFGAIGNLSDGDKMEQDVWNSQNYQDLRKAMFDWEMLPDYCKKCKVFMRYDFINEYVDYLKGRGIDLENIEIPPHFYPNRNQIQDDRLWDLICEKHIEEKRMSFGKINSEKYWEERFSTNDWEKYEGGKQSAYFADLARRAFPDWFNQALKRNDWTVADWGCAEGDGTAVLAKSFPMCHFIGIDFSSAAIQKAQEKYPFCDFKTGDMTSEIANSDVIFSSNTLEHLKAPGVILKRLVAAAQKHAVILIPLHDELELSEHFSTFDEDFFPLELEGYPLSYFHIIDCQGNPLWPGEQLLVIYSNPQYLPENRSLSELFSNVAYLRLKEERNHIKTELQLEREHLETAKKTSNELNERLQEKTTQLSQVKEQLNEKADQILKLETDLNEKTEKLSQTEIQLNEQTDRFSKAEIQLNEQTVQISEATHTLNEKVTQLNKQNEQLEQLKGQITQVSELKTCLDKKKKELFDVKQQFNRKTEEMAAAEQKIDETTQSLNQMEEECRKQKQIQTALKSQLCASNEKIDASIQLLYSMLGSKQIRLIHFINRFKYQGFHSDPEERKKFRKWLFSRFQKTPDSDRRYHPLFPVIRMLEDARNLSNGMFAENTETVSSSLYLEKNRNHAKQKTMPETDNQKLQILSELYEKPDIIILAIIDYDFRHQRPQHFAQRLAQKGHRVFYVNANFSNKFSQKKLGENLWQITLVNTDFTAIYPNDWSNHLDQMKDQMDQILDKNAIRDAVVIVDYPNWVHCALYLREKYGLRIVTDYMDDFTGFLNPAEDMVRKNCEKLLQESNGVMASSEFLYNIASQYSSHVAMNRNGTEYDYFHQAWDLAKNCKKERPIIGYYGAIAEWFHAEIVCQCAERFQECEIVLVGNITAHREELERYHNIRLVGEVPYTKLLPWLASFDVCLIPFDASTDLIKATNPVKFYEYLSAGKKIVATEIPELRPYQDRFVYLENDAEKFCNAVDACLHGTDKLAAPEECFAFAKENDWDARAEVFENEALAVYPKISVIVLCYNQLDYTKKCVESVLNTTAYPNYELILVDNASSDGTADYLKGVAQEYAQVKIVLNQTNRGFAGGNNDGISIADGDYLVLLNNDTIVTRGWLTGLLKHFQNDSTVGLVGPVTNSIGNEAKIQVNYTELSKMAGFADAYTFMHMGEEYPHHGILAMFCLMISRGLYEKVGPLDEQYGIGMFEDDDYSIASEKLGYRNVLAEDVFIHHFGSVSFKKLEDSTYRAVFEQNKTYYEEKWKEPWRKPFYRPDVT